MKPAKSPLPMATIGVVGERGASIAADILAPYGLTVDKVRAARSRRFTCVLPRQHLMWVLREAGYSEPAIGRFMNRDPSTVSDGSSRHRARMAWAEVLISIGTEAYQPDLFRWAA